MKRGQNTFDENHQREWSPTAQMSWYYSPFVVFWWLSAKTRANTYYEEQNKFGFCIFGAGCKRNHDNHIKRPWHEIARNLCLNMESKWRGCVFRFKHGISLARLCSCLKKCKLCWRSSRGDCTWPDCHDGDDIYIMMKCVSVCNEKWSLPPGSLL